VCVCVRTCVRMCKRACVQRSVLWKSPSSLPPFAHEISETFESFAGDFAHRPERATIEVGLTLGATATGLLMIRMVDPRDETVLLQAFCYKQIAHVCIVGGGLFTSSALTILRVGHHFPHPSQSHSTTRCFHTFYVAITNTFHPFLMSAITSTFHPFLAHRCRRSPALFTPFWVTDVSIRRCFLTTSTTFDPWAPFHLASSIVIALYTPALPLVRTG
jgi:hypothetical protein